MAQRKAKQKREAPAKEVNQLRDYRLNIRFRPEEVTTLKNAADAKHTTISSFARSAALEAAEEIMSKQESQIVATL